ncbi:MAG TPA: hypothetical protein VMR59_03210 [Patescibacteria group bacterium]|jgi:hypothetical protein|nr:hypothetical protein [Patescibacteria group bacterium]
MTRGNESRGGYEEGSPIPANFGTDITPLTHPNLKDHYLGTQALATLRPSTEHQPDELPEALRTSIDHLFDLISGKVQPEKDEDWDIVEEHDQMLRAITPANLSVKMRHRPEQATPRSNELIRIGQSDEFTASEQPKKSLTAGSSEKANPNIDRYPGIKDPKLRAFLRHQDVYFLRAEPETNEERELVKQRRADLAKDYSDRVWGSGRAGTRRSPFGGPRW